VIPSVPAVEAQVPIPTEQQENHLTESSCEKSADAKVEVPAAELEVKPDVAASDKSTDIIPEPVPCATEQDIPTVIPSVPAVEARVPIPTEQQENHVTESASDSAQASASGTDADTTVDNDKVAATQPSATDELAADQALEAEVEVDPIQSWDAPQGLPAPSDDKAVGSMPPTDAGGERRSTSGKPTQRQAAAAAGKRADRSQHQPPASARSATSAASGGAKKGVPPRAITPFFVDVAYVPTYAIDGCDAEFFRRVRARYYIIPGSSADPHQLSMLADAKSAWEGDVTVIPTGNTDALIAWVIAHRDELASLKIEVTPSVARSTIHLDRGSACSAYRLEF